MKESIEKRIHGDIIVSKICYTEAIFDIIGFLCEELKHELNKENRFYGVVKTYFNNIDTAFNKFYKNINNDSVDMFGRILYLYKPVLVSEYKKLVKFRKLTSGDSLIVIINKLLELASETNEFPHKKELRTIKGQVQRLFDNIRNRNKKDPMYQLFNTLREGMERGVVGKYVADEISFDGVEKNTKEPIEGTGVRINEESDLKLGEVTWIGD